jgi:DNA repair exonuclease SbcCD ATPase subunit
MIQIEEIHIEEFRGIRKLPLTLSGKNFCICGPNGSGKSGVVDAIEFALTGDISRLSGEGTGGLSVSKHGAHVDKRDDVGAAFVSLKVRILRTGKTVTITRGLKKPKELLVEPEDSVARGVLEEVALHKEITLSRREIIKFILAKASDRSRDVQTLLKLDEIDDLRAVLKTTSNRLASELETAQEHVQSTSDDLRRHLDLPDLSAARVLESVNKRRGILGLPMLKAMEKDTSVSEGVAEMGEVGKSSIHKTQLFGISTR